MNKFDLKRIGVPNSCLDLGVEFCTLAAKGGLFRKYKPAELIEIIMADPQKWFNDSIAGRFAKALALDAKLPEKGPAPYKVWGEDGIDLEAINQLREAVKLPVSVRGALMPDAHVGYGLPIGGVLATVKCVIPYAVGVDIACRMKMTVIDVPPNKLAEQQARFEQALLDETRFGVGCNWEKRRDHPVMDKDWGVTQVTKQLKDLASSQLGTSGGGNHFVEFGLIEFKEKMGEVEPNKPYVAILSHSGSRGPGSKVCDYYSKLAIKQLPAKYTWAKRLAWLDLDSEEGQEYWLAMQLMGEFAAANHDIVHQQLVRNLVATPLLTVENHHNFAWKEIHDGIEVVVHRKGATPAGSGVLGVIPGSMGDPAYVVRGSGNAESLKSSSHGAGRKYGRNVAKQKFSWDYWREELKRRGVHLMSAGIDEVPGVYKDINEVMQRQSDLVEIVAKFDPKIVRMADDGLSED